MFGFIVSKDPNERVFLLQVSPAYMAALEAIRNLDFAAVEEIKTYIKPPQQVRQLVEIIFHLLDYNAGYVVW